MYALFQDIKTFGLDLTMHHRDELTSLECMELLLHDPDTIAFVPTEKMTTTAWYYFLLDDKSEFGPIYRKIPWARMPLAWRETIEALHPDFTLPESYGSAECLEEEPLLISAPLDMDPSHPSPEICFLYGEDARLIEHAIDPSEIMDMFRRTDSSGYFLSCTCSVPECAGFFEKEYVHLTPSIIHLSYNCYGERCDFYFDREEFEIEFAKILSRLLIVYKEDPDKVNEYILPPYSIFVDQVKRFAKENPHLEEHLAPGLESAGALAEAFHSSESNY